MQQFAHAPSTYHPQPQILDSYWTQEPNQAQSYPTEISNNLSQQYDFNNIPTDLFQPEEIFQLDQPIKPDFVTNTQSDITRSPPTLLDLGSGTIHREFKSEEYWNHNVIMLNDDSNSSNKYNLSQSPDSMSMNNNLIPTVDQNVYMESGKVDEMSFGIQKGFYQTANIMEDYSKESHQDHPVHQYDFMDNKLYFEDHQQYEGGTSTYEDIKNYKLHYQEEYIDAAQYCRNIEYGGNFINLYDNKINNSSTNNNNNNTTNTSDSSSVFDLDFRISNLSGSNNNNTMQQYNSNSQEHSTTYNLMSHQ